MMLEKIKSNKKIAVGAISAVILIALIAYLAISIGNEKLTESFTGAVDIKPVYASEYGVGATQGFTITSADQMTDELIKDSLILKPSFEYAMKSGDNGRTYTIEPKTPLLPGTVYQIAMDPSRALAGRAPRAAYTWAFQTESDFKLLGGIPADQGTGVPVNTVLRFTFSQAVDVKTAPGFISVTPEIDGNWEASGEQLTFVPKSDLDKGTVYNVTIKPGLPNAANAAVLAEGSEFQFQTQIAGEDEGNAWYQIENDNNCFRTDEAPAFRYYRNWNVKAFETCGIEIYRFDDENKYIEALKSRAAEYPWCFPNAEKLIDTTALAKVAGFEQKDLSGFVLRCPESLEAGFYLADFKADGMERQSLFQVTDLSGYFATGDKDSLVWLNSLVTGDPVNGASVTLVGTDKSYLTDESGVAVIPGSDERNPILTITNGDARLVMEGYNYHAGFENPSINPYDYWYYLSTDRQIYHPGDTVDYFGIMAPRNGSGKSFTDAELVLSGGAYWGDSAIRQKVKIEDGVISGALKLPELKSDWYSISIEIDGQAFGYAGFEVAFYDKPAYRFDLKSDKTAVFAGEQITWDINAGYFEGTPVAGLQINVSHDGVESKVTTGGEGGTTIAYAAPPPDSGYLTGGSYISVSAVMPELGDVSAYGNVTVFNSDIDIDGSVKRSGDSFDLNLKGYDVNLDSINEGAQIWRGEYRRPLTGSCDIEATLMRIEYDKITNGPYYDDYTLQTYYTYDYKQRKVKEGGFSMALTGNGLDFTGKLGSDNGYELVLTGKDHKGRQFSRSYYIPQASKETFAWGNSYRYAYINEINSDYYSHAVGDSLKFALMSSEVQLPKPEKGNILYFRSQEKIRDYKLSEDGTYEMTFSENDIPNVNLAAVYFDGQYYTQSAVRYVSLNPADKAAKVEITTDKQRYAPGDTVNMTLSMTDKGGKPLSGSVNVSIVDEALFALAENYVDIGASVFSNQYYFPYSGAVSHQPVDSSQGGAEMGDGGGEREDFRDTAFFETVRTDADGNAKLSFKLPDNITSWRITWQAYSPGIFVGNGSQNIDSSLDFFLDYRLANTFLASDEPKIGLRSAGRGIDPLKSRTNYTAEIPDLGYTGAASGQANVWQELALPKLTQGSHQVKLSAENSGYKDAVNMDISVIQSFASYQYAEETQLTGATLPPGSGIYPTTLVFSDKAYSEALTSLYNLAWRDGIRLEQKLVSKAASDLLAGMGVEYFSKSDEADRTARNEIIQYQRGNGGISSFTYSDADIETSALAASVGKEYFDDAALSSYFYDYLKKEDITTGEKAVALWGLAALNEPVLLDIQEMLDSPGLSGEDELSLAMALYFAGDGAKAKTIAEGLVSEFTEDLGNEIRAKIGAGDDAAQTKATARLALLASAFDLPQAGGLVQYMMNNTYDGDYYLLEKMGIAQNRLETLPEGDAKFTYSLGGATKTIDLHEQAAYSLTLLPEQLSEIRFSNVSGDITMLSCYMKEGRAPDGAAALGQLTLKRSVNGSGDSAVTVPQNKPVRISLEFSIAKDAPNGCYTITDMLPAGLRFGNVEGYYYYAQVGGNENKEVKFSIYKTDYSRYKGWQPAYYQKDGSLKGTITYTAYPAMTGSFTAEAPYFGHSIDDNILIHAPETRITIQ